MKKGLLVVATHFILLACATAQQPDDALQKNRAFTGATADQKNYKAIYQLDNGDPKIIDKAIININNALSDPRFGGKIKIELIAFSGGSDAYLKGSKYEEQLKDLVSKGVIVAQCNNTLILRKISRDQLYDFIAVVPSGNGELILRHADRWAIVKP